MTILQNIRKRFLRPRNSRALVSAKELMPSWVAASPTYAQLEVTNRCNIRCVMCPIEELTQARRKKWLKVEELEYILDELPYLEQLHLQGIGEPLTNPYLAEMIAKARARGITVGVITNGTLLDRDKGEAMIRAGLSNITISLDSANAENYQTIRKGADFEEVTRNIRDFVALRKSLGSPTPWIGIMMVAMNNNIREIEEMTLLANRLGVDALTVKGLNPVVAPELKIDAGRRDLAKPESGNNVLRPEFRVNLAYLENSPVLRCRWPWMAVYVTAEGYVTPCCNCPDARQVSFGNLFQQPFRSIWNNASYRAFRNELRDGKPEVCVPCPDWHQSM